MDEQPGKDNSFLQQLQEFLQSVRDNENLKILIRVVLFVLIIAFIIFIGSSLGKIENLIFSAFPTSAPAPTATPGVAPPPGPPPESLLDRLGRFLKSVDWGRVWGKARYGILPVGAFVIILLTAGRYVQDIYALKRYRHGLRYVISSMSGLLKPEVFIDKGKVLSKFERLNVGVDKGKMLPITGEPQVVVDKGKIQLKSDEFNLITAIGGPGTVIVQPGNAVLFRSLRRPSKVGLKQSVALGAFETIGEIVNLDDQQNHEDAMDAVTQDGIRVKLTDINYRFRIIATQPRAIEDPYPFDIAAVNNMAYNRAVTGTGQLDEWRTAVHKLVKSLLGDYINAHTIDFLTAPREDGQDPRSDMRRFALAKENGFSLRNIGADLLWIDVGHVDITMPDVDQERFNVWSADWVGSAEVTRAYGEAKRQAYTEIGRAEAQAEMIMSIASALRESEMDANPGKNLQYILLARTAQILDSLKEAGPLDEGKNEFKG
jgi:hypothetical protein